VRGEYLSYIFGVIVVEANDFIERAIKLCFDINGRLVWLGIGIPIMLGRDDRPGQTRSSFRSKSTMWCRRQDRCLARPSSIPTIWCSIARTDRPSIDPELMMRMLIFGYVFAIRSERMIWHLLHVTPMSRGAHVHPWNHWGTDRNCWMSCHVNSMRNVTWNIADENT